MARRPKPRPSMAQHCDTGMLLQPVGSHATNPFVIDAISDTDLEYLRERLADEYGGYTNWIKPIVLDNLPKPRCIFICEYCGSVSESMEPCKNCLAPRTREQLHLWARGSR